MWQSAVGLSEDQIRLVTCALDVTGNHDLTEVYQTAVDILDCLLSLLLKEMFSIRSDIVYWERMSKSNHWEILLFQWNSRIYRTVFFQKEFPHALLENTQDMVNHIESLRADFQELSITLAKLQEASALLKSIYEICSSVSVFNPKYMMKANVTTEVSIDEAPHTLRAVVHKTLEACIAKVGNALYEHLSAFVQSASSSVNIKNNLKFDNTQLLHEYASNLQAFLHQVIITRGNDEFPLDFSVVKTKRPSNFERYWVRNVLLTIAGMYSAQVIVGMIKDGSLQEIINHFVEWITSKLTEHVVEPVTKLGQELFDTIRNREQIVSRQDLELSKEALERMLTDFSKSKQGYDLILPKLKEELMKNKDRILSKDVVDAVSESAATAAANAAQEAVQANVSNLPQIHTVESIRTGDPLKDLSPTPEQALVALMNEYEKELQTPIRGMLFGNLFTALLIQMQKLKVHTEAAMLTMDQILASNELTIAATAAMPAFAFFAYVVYSIRNAFRPKAQVPGLNTLHFSLILSDVERALCALEEIESSHRCKPKISLQPERVFLLPASPAKRRAILQQIDPQLDEKDFDFHTFCSSTNAHEKHHHILNSNSDSIIALEATGNSTENNCCTPPSISIDEEESRSNKNLPSRNHDRTYWIAKGTLSFHLVRLRSKFFELFNVSSDMKEILTGKPSKSTQTVTVYHIQHRELIRSSPLLSIWFNVQQTLQSGVNLLLASYTFLFGSNEIQSLTTQYHSLDKDITILESPCCDVGLRQKIETAKRMRMSYKLLSPVHY